MSDPMLGMTTIHFYAELGIKMIMRSNGLCRESGGDRAAGIEFFLFLLGIIRAVPGKPKVHHQV